MTNEYEKLAGMLNIAGTEAWKTLVKAAPYAATGEILGILVFLTVGIWAVKYGLKKIPEDGDYGGAFNVIWVVAGAIAVAMCLTCFCVEGPSLVAAFTCPEYWALTQILAKH